MSAALEPILDARGIHAWYGSSHVLHGVDLAIGRGETVGLLGRNGMGKSTLIRALLGLVRERAGRIEATLNLWTRINGGTEVELVVPGHVVFARWKPSAAARLLRLR